MSPDPRTVTALHSPFSDAEKPETAAFLLIGGADAPGPSAERRLLVCGECLEIGRKPMAGSESNVCVLDDGLVSSRHARIVHMDDGWEVMDLQSKNGTFLNDSRVTEHVRLKDGALLFIGGHVAVFRMVSAVELEAIRAELAAPFGPVSTVSPSLALACDRLRRLAPADGEILIVGETGVGKEVYARAVHKASGRAGRFVAINCAAIPRDLVESELFGYRQGAHSTAHQSKAGLIEEAEGGTLFLDEIGEMAPEAQTKLLRFLQDRELTPLGGTRPRRVDLRFIAATSRYARISGGGWPGASDGAGGLRGDVVGRLGAAPIRLPPLRSRIEDLGALAAHLHRGPSPLRFETPAFRAMCLYDWPLNVRELEKTLATTSALTGGERPIALRDLPDVIAQGVLPERKRRPTGTGHSIRGAAAKTAAPVARSPSPTKGELDALLRQHEGKVAEVARVLGKQRAAVWRWIKKFGIGPDKYRK